METEKKAAMMGEIIALAAAGKLPLDVGETYNLDQAAEAAAAALVPGRKGKILLRG